MPKTRCCSSLSVVKFCLTLTTPFMRFCVNLSDWYYNCLKISFIDIFSRKVEQMGWTLMSPLWGRFYSKYEARRFTIFSFLVIAARYAAVKGVDTAGPFLDIKLNGDGDITRVLRVEGTLSPDYPDVARFLGIQFAKSKRFRHSDLMLLNDLFDKVSDSFSANDAFLDATNSGPSCPQRCTDSDSILCDSGEIQAEDCLTLDIYVPQHFLPKSNPPPVNNVGTAVFVFLHGGAFRTGSIRGVYQGDYLSSQTDSIVVTVNYRLGMLGWLRFGNLIPGNQGFSDQLNALSWVKQSIKHFGGDPVMTTLMGHSAGAVCVACHLVSPRSVGLFSRAAMFSPSLGDPRKTIKQAEVMAGIALNSPDVSSRCGKVPDNHSDPDFDNCISTVLGVDALLNAQIHADHILPALDLFYALHSWDITVDGDLIPTECTTALGKGELTAPIDVPIMMGSVSNEGQLLLMSELAKLISNPAVILAATVMLFGPGAPELLKAYHLPAGRVEDINTFLPGNPPKLFDRMFRLARTLIPVDGKDDTIVRMFGDYTYTVGITSHSPLCSEIV
eukprot:GHVT01065521.1.p1 GENE.GHVT01065521.1~~GHVT01065521.1.p1  ORF type:complete len:557 (-),score=15.56 GHVT01065521.1:3216-4886(-)